MDEQVDFERKIREAFEKILGITRDETSRFLGRPCPGEYDSEIPTTSQIQSSLSQVFDSNSTGFSSLDEFYKPSLAQWTVVTGIPGHGKTSWLDQMMINMAFKQNWKFGVFSAESQPIARYARGLITKFIAKPWEKITILEKQLAIDEIFSKIFPILPTEEHLSLDYLLDFAVYLVDQKGINGFIIDPWNELEHNRDKFQPETEYISACLSKVRRCCRKNNIHIWIVAHPAKMLRNSSGKYPVPTLYDISGSAAWRNKADFGIVVWRDIGVETKANEIYVQKVRFQENGKCGVAKLKFDYPTGRYLDLEGEYAS